MGDLWFEGWWDLDPMLRYHEDKEVGESSNFCFEDDIHDTHKQVLGVV